MAIGPRNRPHFLLKDNGAVEPYRRPNRKIDPPALPLRNRQAHAQALALAVGGAVAAAEQQLAAPGVTAFETRGFYLEFDLPSSEGAGIDQLANRQQKMEVVAVRELEGEGGIVKASVFVPERAKNYFLNKIEQYRTTDTDKGRPRNEPLISRIETAQLASARSLFTDEEALFPLHEDVAVWWEVWLREGRRERFEAIAAALEIQMRQHAIRFPEREVVLALASSVTMDRVVARSDTIAELRRAKDTPAFFIGLGGAEQRAWNDDLADRVQVAETANDVAICLLDSGVRRTHPLIEPVLSVDDWHTINPDWGADDTPAWQGHGTRMAGVALYNDLIDPLAAQDPFDMRYRLESIRILPPGGADENQPDLYGAITGEAIARAEIQAPHRSRVITTAITSTTPSRGRASSWSSSIDQLCFETDAQRLILISAGNIRIDLTPADLFVRNDIEPLDDPAQAWNAITIGAFTNKVDVIDAAFAGYTPIAPAGELSPASRTSVSWDRQWPVKPDIVMEGGNLAYDGVNPGEPIDDLRILTTHFRPENRYFSTIGDTSSATAQAAKLAAEIMVGRPGLWPETVRALLVHSAEWTPAMAARITNCHGNKTQLQALLRRYGYGVPDLGRALLSANNDLTLMIEDDIRPFQREGTGSVKMRDMKLHKLPWPKEDLLALGAAPVEVRVTLSYFIEPNPGERGWTRRHRYASHGLRFQMKTATETVGEFRARINQAARSEEEGAPVSVGEGWLLGTFRDSGSLHSDFWRGTAVDLAERDAIGIFPVGGWWKEKPYLDRYNQQARYSLIVTIRAANAAVDLYAAVETILTTEIVAEA
ncbi:UNVERIFIED_ORG: hypothetical protein GGE64_005547 [Rhizobium etli]|jgi:hypothetical protein|uniref:Hypothetical conserved protein n=1 Tax=Rhizobium etli (strain ATCC 51251 / DSM 11541 / JCM 21823 / NBRC 15573 / CFN 42) TaxID=347834 RepID=Q8KKT4_RHIEC|nr:MULTISPECIES: S8 family peptidase [Rhizobium]KEC70875.1 hypothetical protein RLPCCGM1_p0649 [Rhizobium leguminosarum bv. phaseoli CCGM1]AAM55046.1 hypothetical conserved protein [Rhizobium etli CFN 42]ANM06810.1 peptidase S8/S53 family subtilisin-related protein [Rhizobium phaseoli]MBP2484516.1 hypothetical protein [Rhizobium leguminosarum]PWI50898.1 hypothetical protein B5K03_28260 [Rhizobium phaseoli]